MSEPTAIHHFHTQKERFNEVKKVLLFRSALFIVLAVPGGIAIGSFGSNGAEMDMSVFFLTLPIALGAAGFGVFAALKRQKKIFETFRLSLNSEEVIREAQEVPTFRMARSSIREIIKKKDGSFSIKGKSRMEIIEVPAQMQDYEDLERLLAEIRPITANDKLPFYQTIIGQILLSLFTLGLMATTYISDNKTIVLVSGTLIIGLMAYSFFEVQTNKNVDHRTKNVSWIFLFVMVSIIGMMYFKLMGG